MRGPPPGRRAPPDSPNCPPVLASAPSLVLPNCMSVSRVRGDMGRSMVLLKEVLREGGRAEKAPGSGPGWSPPTPPLPPDGPQGTAEPLQRAPHRKGAPGGEGRAAARAERSPAAPGQHPHPPPGTAEPTDTPQPSQAVPGALTG